MQRIGWTHVANEKIHFHFVFKVKKPQQKACAVGPI